MHLSVRSSDLPKDIQSLPVNASARETRGAAAENFSHSNVFFHLPARKSTHGGVTSEGQDTTYDTGVDVIRRGSSYICFVLAGDTFK